LPHRRGFRNVNRKVYAIVNLADLEIFALGTEITPELLKKNGLVRKMLDGVKILGEGEISKALTVRAHKFSKSAEEKLKTAGGTAEVV
jgi:large subunit ribosomal protein L15